MWPISSQVKQCLQMALSLRFFTGWTTSYAISCRFGWSAIVVRLVSIIFRRIFASDNLLSFQILNSCPDFSDFSQNFWLFSTNLFAFVSSSFTSQELTLASLLSNASLFCLSNSWDANSLTCFITSLSVKTDEERIGRKFAARMSSRCPVSKTLINVYWIRGSS